MDDTTIGQMFSNRVGKYGPCTLFEVKRNGQYTDILWEEAARAVKELAMGLLQLEVEHGDHVSLLSENRPEWAFADLAILSIGAVDVPIYATNTPKQVEYIIKDSGSRILIVSSKKQLQKGLDARDLVKNEKVVKLISDRVEAVNSQLAKYETIKKFEIMDEDFTLESGELTPTLKIKRKVVSQKYKDLLDSFYKE